MSSAKVALAGVLLGLVVGSAAPASAGTLLGFQQRSIVVATPYLGVPGYYPPYAAYPPYVAYPPYLPYDRGAYFRPRPYVYGGPEYLPGANWRDNWYDATRQKVHGYTLR